MQKKWTVVLEITDLMPDAADADGESVKLTRNQIEEIATEGLRLNSGGIQWQVMEIIDAPYGPQGVSIRETPRFKVAQACICRAGSRFINPDCRAKVHKS